MEGAKSARVVLLPLPYEGHLNPMLQLGTTLHSKGFSITVLHTHFCPPNSSDYPEFDFLSIPDGLSDYEATSGDFMAVIMSLNDNCGTALHESLVRMMESQEQQNEIGCIIYDSLMYFAEAVAKRLKLPSLVLRTCCVSHVMIHHIYPLLQKSGDIPIQESKLMEIVSGTSPIRYKDLAIYKFYDVKAYFHVVSKVVNIRSPSIWNTVECLEQPALAKAQQLYQVPIFPIGPLHKVSKPSSSSLMQEDANCINWLDNHPESSVIYISLGSIAKVEEKELIEMAWGLANSKQPFLWVIRPGSVVGSEWIELLPAGFRNVVGERCCIVKWAPQRRVVEHNAVGGFWSHCGWNSTIESIAEGVPLICRPCSGDQRVNARYLSQVWKIGLPLENDFERGDIEMTVRRLMVDEEGKILRQRAADLKKEIQISTMEGGSSYNSMCQLVEFIKLSV